MSVVVDEKLIAPRQRLGRVMGRWLVILAGIAVGQAILYGPSLAGRKLLLPLDILAEPGYYLPATPGPGEIVPQDPKLTDLVLHSEPSRRFLGSEIRAGHFPFWNPNQYAGVPDTLPKFSPFALLGAAFESPAVIPWVELLKAVVSGVGVYQFCRRVLGVAFWPATIAAWCYPLTGFFVLWQGFATAAAVVWLPWLLLAVDRTARSPRPGAAVGLSVVTGLVLTSGQLDIAGQMLLASGLYGVWCLWDAYGKGWFKWQARKAGLALAAGWGLGFLLAAPYLLPVLQYVPTGVRMAHRGAGEEERPPIGLVALPQVVLPNMYGSTEHGSYPIFPQGQGNLSESSAAAYTGLLATLFVAPLAWCSRRHRAGNWFWVLLGFFALSWCLDIPVLVDLLRLPGLNFMSHNRFVFAASFSILALAAVGLDVLWRGQVAWQRWFWVPTALLAGLGAWCVGRALFLPEPIKTQLASAVARGHPLGHVRDLTEVHHVQAWFIRSYAIAAVWCGLGVAGWVWLARRKAWPSRLVAFLGLLLAGDLIWFGFGCRPQCDPALYYPRLPALEAVAKAGPGRVIGYNCLPSLLPEMCGLRDIRGYDAIDPARFIELLKIGGDPRSLTVRYAAVQWLTPKVEGTPEGDIRLSPVLDLLGVRYVIFRKPPVANAHAAFQSPGYWVCVNPAALPRAFVPRRVEVVTDDRARLKKLASPQFDPRDVAYVESPVNLPGPCLGTAEVVEESPGQVALSLLMETPGLVVLADYWDQGWRAYVNGQPAPILRADHALRGVIVPAGSAGLQFRYEPQSFAWGLRLAGFAAVVLVGWLVVGNWLRKRAGRPG